MNPTVTSQFDAFLYAAIEDEPNGMPLTVLSALARKDLDPWEEAESLLQLGPDAATRKLASFIRMLPQGPTPRSNADTIAARLIALLTRPRPAPASGGLPRVGDAPNASADRTVSGTAATDGKPHVFVHYLLFYLLFVAVLIGSQWLSPSSEPQAHTEAASAAAPPLASAVPAVPLVAADPAVPAVSSLVQ
jgi:hypothetical protein